MAEFTNELRQLADSATHQARPLPAAEVLRRGDRRRRAVLAQRAVGGLAGIGLVAAALVTAGATRSPAAPTAPGSATASRSAISISETATAATGTLTLQAKYSTGAHRRIKLASVTFSGHSTHAVKNPRVIVDLGPDLLAPPPTSGNPPRSFFFFLVTVKLSAAHDFSGSLPAKDLAKIRQSGGLLGEAPLTVTLESFVKRHGGEAHVPVLTAEAVMLSSP